MGVPLLAKDVTTEMVKRILAALGLALGIVGCGGSGGSSGTSFVTGVNAIPNVGAVSITANGTVVLSDAPFGTNSATFVGVNAGAGAQLFLTNSGSTQLASGLTTFTANQYYTAYALGAAPAGVVSSAYVFVYPTDVSQPPANEGNLIFVNSSTMVAVDVYATLSGSVIGAPVESGLSPFNSGVEATLAVGTYTIQFNQAGTGTVLTTETVTIGATPSTNEIQVIGITDNQTGTTPAQFVMPPIPVPVVAGAAKPANMGHPIVVGHPGMTSFPRK